MHLTWIDTAGKTCSQPVPCHLLPYVEALGLERAVAFFLAFGGAPVYLSDSPRDEGQLLGVLTREELGSLRLRFPPGPLRVPIPAKFIARALKGSGAGTFEIARELRRTHSTVSAYLRGDAAEKVAA